MRVIVASAQFPPTRSGYSRVAGNLAEQFRRDGHTVIPLTEPDACSRYGRVPVLNSRGRRLLREGADIVQVIGPSPPFSEQVVWEAHRQKIPVVYALAAFAGLATFYAGPIPEAVDTVYQRTVYRIALRMVDAAIFHTRDFAESFGLVAIPWTVIPLGANDPCATAPCPVRSLGGADDGSLRVLFTGQLRRAKGVANLIRAVGELHAGGKPVRLTIVGDGPQRPRLEQMVDHLGLRSLTTFKGRVDDAALHAEYLSNDVLVLPSLLGESFGIVLVEARLHGLQVIASDLPGVRELVREFNGQVVPPGDVGAIARALSGIERPKPEARQFNSRLAARFSWSETARQFLAVYRDVLNGGRARETGPTVVGRTSGARWGDRTRSRSPRRTRRRSRLPRR
jgi:glycosyltransferase involved in cell wall biosynthesis